MGQLRALGIRDRLRGVDHFDLSEGVATVIVPPEAGGGGFAPSPHGLSSAHHSGEITASQASWAAYEENGGTDRPAYNANRMTAALAHVVPNATDTYDLGTSTKWWRGLYASQINGAVFVENVAQLLGGWFVVGHAQGTLETPSAYLQVETATVLGSITNAVAQVETIAVSGTATANGTITATVTAAGMTGSPIATDVAFVDGQTAASVADAIKVALGLDADITDFFTISGTGANVVLTVNTAAANDGTMNIALSGASAQGFVDVAASTNTTAGVASGAGTVSVIVTAAGMAGSPITVTTGLDATAGMTATQVATMVAANLPGANATIDAFFTITSSGADLIFTAKAYTAANDATMNIAIDNGSCTGLTAAPTSTSTTAGGNRTDIDFGVTLAVNDFIVIKSHDAAGTISTEYMQVSAAVSGTTYTVTRNLNSNPSVPVWLVGTPWLNNGYTGDGRIELNAYDTPRIQLITQGATYNAQTEVVRIGDLNTGWGYVAETYGIAIGSYAASAPNITIDATNGLRIRSYTTEVLTFDTSGNAKITGKLQMPDSASAIAIGTTPPTSASAGTGVWIDRTGIYGLNSNTKEFYLDAATGKGVFGAGTATLDSSGITLTDTLTIHLIATATAAGSKETLYNVLEINPASASSAEFNAIYTSVGPAAGCNENLTTVRNVFAVTSHSGSGMLTDLCGYYNQVVHSGSSTVSGMACYDAAAVVDSGATVTTAYLLRGVLVNNGTIGTMYGIYIGELDGSTTYSIYQHGANDLNVLNGPVDMLGLVGIGMVNASGVGLAVEGTGTTSSTYTASFRNATPANEMYLRNDDYQWVSQAWNIGSDVKLKKNIRPLTGALESVKRLKPAKYDRTSGRTNRSGFIAQELREVLPDLVSDAALPGEEPLLAIAYTELIPYLVQAIQEQQAEIEELRSRVA